MKRENIIFLVIVILIGAGLLYVAWQGPASEKTADETPFAEQEQDPCAPAERASQDPCAPAEEPKKDPCAPTKDPQEDPCAPTEKEEGKGETSEQADAAPDEGGEKAADPNTPETAEADAAEGAQEEGDAEQADAEPEEPAEPNEPLEAVNLKDVAVKDLIGKLADWTGKVIIPHQDVMGQKITIFAPTEVPRSQALGLIYAALQTKGYIVEETEQALYLKPLKEARLTLVPTVGADEQLALLADKSRIVQKFFRLRNYSATQLQQIILPLIPEYGYVTADEASKTLVVIETVANLQRIERIIGQLDVPEAEQTITEVFVLQSGDPYEIVQLLRLLLSDGKKGRGSGAAPPAAGNGAATAIVVGQSTGEIVLIPEPQRKWIIARASAEKIAQIAEWINKLDAEKPDESDYEVVQVTYADVEELGSRLNSTLQKMPGSELRSSVLVQPLRQARQIMIFGSPSKREMVKTLIAEIDVPSENLETKHFKLKYADPLTIKQNLEALYDPDAGRRTYYYYRRRSRDSSETVKVIAFDTLKQVTVTASPAKMEEIALQIEEWDAPIDVDDVKPMILELHNSDPVKITDLLSKLFSEETKAQRPWWYYWEGGRDASKKVVGALYGKLTFEPVPETKKIIVISQVPEAYDVIRELVAELDKQVAAELPMVVTLKYADCEMLCEQLNAILNETGTASPFRLSRRGLSDYSVDVTSGERTTGSDNNDENAASNMVTPWWDRARSRPDQAMPTSNMIGKVRFIPVYRSKAILVLAAAEYHDALRTMIEELDKPAKQILIKVVLLLVDHKDTTSLGVEVSSNPDAFGTLSSNMLEALNVLTYGEDFGALRLDSLTNVNVLVDLLVKNADAKILNEPSIWTKDNEEAVFFKGRSVPFIEGSQTSEEGTSIRNEVKYRNVGVTLRVRPNITPEKSADLTINLMVSEVEPETINGNIVTTLLDNTTNLIVADGQTTMLSGILFLSDRDIRTKVPLLGDLPLLGGLFQHVDTIQENSELIAFITPYVFDEDTSPAAREELYERTQRLRRSRAALEEAVAPLTEGDAKARNQKTDMP